MSDTSMYGPGNGKMSNGNSDADPINVINIARQQSVHQERWERQFEWNRSKDEDLVRIYDKLSEIARRIYITNGFVSGLSAFLGVLLAFFLNKL